MITIPKHVSIIMDGNGRWAKSNGLSKIEGHQAGAKSARHIINAAKKHKVRYLTLYTFSSENWNRPTDEVSYLMDLVQFYIQTEAKSLAENGIRLRVIGDLSKVSKELAQSIYSITENTKNNSGLDVIVAFSYGGRSEILMAAKRLARSYMDGEVELDNIDVDEFGKFLYTSGIPDPDLLIRTSGEMRISNFLLWQSAYTEFYFTNKFWPDFNEEDFNLALAEFANRERRYGK